METTRHAKAGTTEKTEQLSLEIAIDHLKLALCAKARATKVSVEGQADRCHDITCRQARLNHS